MSARTLPAWRYTIRQTVAMIVVVSAGYLLLSGLLYLFGWTLVDADPTLPLTY